MTGYLRALVLSALTFLAACAGRDDLNTPPPPLGDFVLGYAAVVADKAKPTGPSRAATADEWEAVLKKQVRNRMDRYHGQKIYHLGIGVNTYALAVPGIPIVLSPKSALVVSVDVWDDAAQQKINPEPKQFTVFESFSGDTVVGSGLTQTKEQQMENLAFNAARQISNWLAENKAWFTPEAVAARAAMAAARDGATAPTSN
ncbi:MAG: hypothetical protein WBA91_03200 [Paracoccaceae bacterium]